jgi:hypothetical protein
MSSALLSLRSTGPGRNDDSGTMGAVGLGQRRVREVEASDKYFAARPGAFNGDRQKLTQDMIIYSLLSYLAVEQRDWPASSYRSMSSGSESQPSR